MVDINVKVKVKLIRRVNKCKVTVSVNMKVNVRLNIKLAVRFKVKLSIKGEGQN